MRFVLREWNVGEPVLSVDADSKAARYRKLRIRQTVKAYTVFTELKTTQFWYCCYSFFESSRKPMFSGGSSQLSAPWVSTTWWPTWWPHPLSRVPNSTHTNVMWSTDVTTCSQIFDSFLIQVSGHVLWLCFCHRTWSFSRELVSNHWREAWYHCFQTERVNYLNVLRGIQIFVT